MRIDTVGRYNFDTAPCRRGTNSLKWDCAEGVISMGIADMDFETAPEVKAAVLARAEHGIYGYSVTPDEFSRRSPISLRGGTDIALTHAIWCIPRGS